MRFLCTACTCLALTAVPALAQEAPTAPGSAADPFVATRSLPKVPDEALIGAGVLLLVLLACCHGDDDDNGSSSTGTGSLPE